MAEAKKIKVEGSVDMDHALKIAFASSDMETINAHFGGTKQFAIYGVTKEGFDLIEVLNTDTSKMKGDDKTDFKVKALAGTNIMYCESIGGTAAAKVIRAGIHPMKVNEPTPINETLEKFQQMLIGNPPPWIKKIINEKDA
ncbi:MAG: nitrogen fixation protein NifX [Epsilonproteobacteria bacterium]|nr:nitrogen fixation protein NifX [Campylobacterota bacterium]